MRTDSTEVPAPLTDTFGVTGGCVEGVSALPCVFCIHIFPFATAFSLQLLQSFSRAFVVFLMGNCFLTKSIETWPLPFGLYSRNISTKHVAVLSVFGFIAHRCQQSVCVPQFLGIKLQVLGRMLHPNGTEIPKRKIIVCGAQISHKSSIIALLWFLFSH